MTATLSNAKLILFICLAIAALVVTGAAAYATAGHAQHHAVASGSPNPSPNPYEE
jgi:hypothetical protein